MSLAFLQSCGRRNRSRAHRNHPHLILHRSFQVLAYDLPRPTFLPQFEYNVNDYLKFEVTYGTLQGLVWLAYYYLLEPAAAVILALGAPSRGVDSALLVPLYP